MLEPVTQVRILEASGAHARRGDTAAAPDELPDLLLIERARAREERAIEALIRRYSRRMFRVACSVLLDEDAAESAGAGADEVQERRELEHAIGGLPEVFRTVFVLRVVEGISGIETAASLGVHDTTVRTRMYRAQRRLAPDVARRVRAASC